MEYQWTNEKPMESGYYWYEGHKCLPPKILYIIVNEKTGKLFEHPSMTEIMDDANWCKIPLPYDADIN